MALKGLQAQHRALCAGLTYAARDLCSVTALVCTVQSLK